MLGELAPNRLTDYLYELTEKFSGFYQARLASIAVFSTCHAVHACLVVLQHNFCHHFISSCASSNA